MKSTSKTCPPANGSSDLRERILSGAVSAVSFDTNIFEMAGLRLEHGYLKHLEQFSKGDVRLVFSEVTFGELRAHLLRKTEEALSSLRKGVADVTTYWASSEEVGAGVIEKLTGRVGSAPRKSYEISSCQ
jgi:predicted nucleic acid-binding protein